MRTRGVVVKLVGTVCWLLFAVAFLGLRMGRGSGSVVKLLGGRGAIVVVSSGQLMALYSLRSPFVMCGDPCLEKGVL